jgi:myo-inositol catabolism protein IolS
MALFRLGRTGLYVNRVALGTWSYGGLNRVGENDVGWAGHHPDDAHDALEEAYRMNIRHWDTADVYGDGRSEELIGNMWKEVPRHDVVLATKVGWDPGPHGHFYHPQWMRERIERSLRLLKSEHIDIYYLHHCLFGDQDELFDGAMEQILRFRDEGKIRFVGLSDWSSEKVAKFAPRADPDVVQVFRCVVHNEYVESGLNDYVDEQDVGAVFFSPLRHGLLLGKYTESTEFPEGDFRRNIAAFQEEDILAKLSQYAEVLRERFPSHPEPILYALLGALLTDSSTGSALVGMRSSEQVLAAATVGEALSCVERDAVLELYREVKLS